MDKHEEWNSLFSSNDVEIALLKYGKDLRNQTKKLFDGDDCVKVKQNFKSNIEKAGFKVIGIRCNDDKVEALYVPETEMV